MAGFSAVKSIGYYRWTAVLFLFVFSLLPLRLQFYSLFACVFFNGIFLPGSQVIGETLGIFVQLVCISVPVIFQLCSGIYGNVSDRLS